MIPNPSNTPITSSIVSVVLSFFLLGWSESVPHGIHVNDDRLQCKPGNRRDRGHWLRPVSDPGGHRRPDPWPGRHCPVHEPTFVRLEGIREITIGARLRAP